MAGSSAHSSIQGIALDSHEASTLRRTSHFGRRSPVWSQKLVTWFARRWCVRERGSGEGPINGPGELWLRDGMHGFIACSPRLCADLLQLKINANIMHKSECQNQHICSRYSLVCVCLCVCQCTRRRSCEGFARVACEPSEIQRKRNILPKSLGGKSGCCEWVVPNRVVILREQKRERGQHIEGVSRQDFLFCRFSRSRTDFPTSSGGVFLFALSAREIFRRSSTGKLGFLGHGSRCWLIEALQRRSGSPWVVGTLWLAKSDDANGPSRLHGPPNAGRNHRSSLMIYHILGHN